VRVSMAVTGGALYVLHRGTLWLWPVACAQMATAHAAALAAASAPPAASAAPAATSATTSGAVSATTQLTVIARMRRCSQMSRRTRACDSLAAPRAESRQWIVLGSKSQRQRCARTAYSRGECAADANIVRDCPVMSSTFLGAAIGRFLQSSPKAVHERWQRELAAHKARPTHPVHRV